jgi:hypothetical protein
MAPVTECDRDEAQLVAEHDHRWQRLHHKADALYDVYRCAACSTIWNL